MPANRAKNGILTTALDAKFLAIVDDQILKHDYCCLAQPERIHTASAAANQIGTSMVREGRDKEGDIKLRILTDEGPLGESQEIDRNPGRLDNDAAKMSVPAFPIDQSTEIRVSQVT